MVSAQARREQALYAIQRRLSHRRACALIGKNRSSLRYQSKMPAKKGPVHEAMKRLSGVYPRFGSRSIRIFLAREGIKLGKERCVRLWAESGLQVPRKCRRRRLASAEQRPRCPDKRNAVWSYDFVYDACANGQALKCLTVIDEFTRECLAIDVAGLMRSSRVIEVLSKLISVHGAPRYMRSDNGPEFVSSALLKWIMEEGIESVLIEPGKPWQNGTNESFNGKFRDECLAMEWFRNCLEAKVVIMDWRNHYSEVRPDSSLGYQTLMEFRTSLANSVTNGARISM
jgi:putative transposase